MIERHRMVIEGFGCRTRTLTDCSAFMTQLVRRLGTLELGRIQINVVPKTILNSRGKFAVPGISVLVEYLESGAGLRTWPEERFVTLDIFSCKEFDSQSIIVLFKGFFSPEKIRKAVF